MSRFIAKLSFICLAISCFILLGTSLVVNASTYESMDNTSYVNTEIIVDSSYTAGAIINVPIGKSLLMKGVDFKYADGVTTIIDKVINVEANAKLVLDDVDFSGINFEIGIENGGIIEVNDVTFANLTDSTSIYNKSEGGSLILRKGTITNIHLNNGHIVVDKNSDKTSIKGVGSNPIMVTMDNEYVGKRVVVGSNVLASYYLGCFEYGGSFIENSQSALLDYVGDNIADLESLDSKIKDYGLVAGDIILTIPYSYVKNGVNVYFANKYCTANYFIEDPKPYTSEVTAWAKYAKFAVQYKSGYYTSYMYQDNYHAMVEAGCPFNDETTDSGSYKYILYKTSSVTIKYMVGGSEFEQSVSYDILTSTTKAVFIDIPKGYEFSSFSTSGSVSVVSNVVGGSYVRPVISCSGSGVIGVNLTEASTTKDVELTFADGYEVDNNNTITVKYSGQDHSSLINPTYDDNGSSVSASFKAYVNGSKVDVIKNAGTYILKFVDTEEVDYITNEYTLVITPKEVEITYSNLNHVFDKTKKVAVAEISKGLISGDKVNVILYNHEQTNAGSYTITANLDSSNYYIADTSKSATMFIDKATIDMTEVKYLSQTHTYTGEDFSLLVENLPGDVKVTYDNNNVQSRVGEYSSTVNFELYDKSNFYPLDITSLTAKLTITKATINMDNVRLANIDTDYTGNNVISEITGEYDKNLAAPKYTYYLIDGSNETKLDDDVYPVNVGNYKVVVSFTLSNERDYFAIDDMEASITINPKLIVMTGVVFDDLTLTYDNKAHSIYATNIPSVVSVSYTPQEFINADRYKVTATFEVNNNYKFSNETTVYEMFAYVNIEKKDYDISGISFDNITVTYDKNTHGITINESLLPEGLSVRTYLNNVHTNAGVYNASVSFINSNTNYNDVADLTAVLTINPKMISVSLDSSVETTYTGSEIEMLPIITGVIDGDVVTVTLSNAKNINASTYHAKVESISNSNYTYDKSLILTYTIDKANIDMRGISLPDIERVYDGNYYTPAISGTLPEVVTYEMTYNPIKNVGEYAVEVNFNVNSNYYKPTSLSAKVTILPKTLTVEFDNYQNLTYDGNNKSVTIIFNGLVEDNFTGYTATYTPNEVKLAGNYTCVVELNEYSNYKILGNNKLDFIVFESKKTYSSSGIDLEITGDKFDPNADFSIKSATLDSATSIMLNSINSQVKASNMISIDMESSEPLMVSLNADFIDVNNSNYVKVYKINEGVLELVSFEIIDGKLTFETSGNEDFIIVQENGFWSRYVILIVILSLVGIIAISLSISIPLIIRRKRK